MMKEKSVHVDNKQRVWAYWQAMARPEGLDTLGYWLHPDLDWNGFEPLRKLDGIEAVRSNFWQPLLQAMPDLQRRPYVFLAGSYEGGDWVCGTGDFVGSFLRDWWGIRASGSSVHFRFGEFCRLEGGQIKEIRIIVDLPDLMRQAGQALLPPSFGRDIWIPGPRAGDGLLHAAQDADQSARSLALVENMIYGGLNTYDQKSQESQGLERFWHPEMVWHGPVGIGSAYGLGEFKRNAQGPIVRAFPDRKGVPHRARVADGLYAASTGWPSLAGTHQNDFMGWPATGKRIGWNIMDFWRRDGELLRENWVMIDLIAAALASGVDLRPQLLAH